MDMPRVLADFNGSLEAIWPISRSDRVTDSDGNEFALAEGMAIHLYEPDTDWYDRDDYLLADGVVIRIPDGPWPWGVTLDERGVYHESDQPDFSPSPISAAMMRETIYRAIERSVAAVSDPDVRSVKLAVANLISELRRIDAINTDA